MLGQFVTAQCDEHGICRTISRTIAPLEPLSGWTFVPLEIEDFTLIGKYWNGTFWEEIVK